MSVTGGQLRIGLFAAVLALLCDNALALWGDELARQVYAVLGAASGIGATTYAVVVVRRVRGTERMWRLLIIAGMASWLFGEVLWWSNRVATGRSVGRWTGVN